ncbi:MAG: A24 family peptidase [Pseudomonadota bacterium]|nr:A24 family peptidase [Pseudomonadota bacterium]
MLLSPALALILAVFLVPALPRLPQAVLDAAARDGEPVTDAEQRGLVFLSCWRGRAALCFLSPALALSAAPAGTLAAVPVAVLATGLTVLALQDAVTRILPDTLTLPLLWIGLLAAALSVWHIHPDEAIIAASIGYCIFRGIDEIGLRLKGCVCLGGGDAKLVAVLGAWCGLEGMAVTVLIASVAMALIAAVKRLRHSPDPYVPLGPALALAGFVFATHTNITNIIVNTIIP